MPHSPPRQNRFDRGERKTTRGRRRSRAINRQIETLEAYREQGYLQEDEIRPVIDELLTGDRDEEQFRREAQTLIQRGDARAMEDVANVMDLPQDEPDEPQGETKTQPQIEVIEGGIVVENPGGDRVVGVPARGEASPGTFLEIVSNIQSEM